MLMAEESFVFIRHTFFHVGNKEWQAIRKQRSCSEPPRLERRDAETSQCAEEPSGCFSVNLRSSSTQELVASTMIGPSSTSDATHVQETEVSRGDCDSTTNILLCPCGKVWEHNANFCYSCGCASTAAMYSANPGRSEAHVAEEPITTLMIYNIPPGYSVEQFIDVINYHGFENTYDLVYKGRRTRFAFVNFVRPEFATKFANVFTEFLFPYQGWDKRSSTKPAVCQGYQALLDLHMNRPLQSGCLLTFNGERQQHTCMHAGTYM